MTKGMNVIVMFSIAAYGHLTGTLNRWKQKKSFNQLMAK